MRKYRNFIASLQFRYGKRRPPGIAPEWMWKKIDRKNRLEPQLFGSIFLAGVSGFLGGFYFTMLTLGNYSYDAYIIISGIFIILGMWIMICSMPEDHKRMKFKNCSKNSSKDGRK